MACPPPPPPRLSMVRLAGAGAGAGEGASQPALLEQVEAPPLGVLAGGCSVCERGAGPVCAWTVPLRCLSPWVHVWVERQSAAKVPLSLGVSSTWRRSLLPQGPASPWGAAAEPKGDGAGPQLRSCPEALPGQGMPSAETPTHPLSLPCHFLEGRGLRAGLVTGRRPREAPHRGPWLLLVLGVSQVKAGSPRRDLSTCQAHYSKARNGATPPAPQDLDQVLEGGGLGTQQGLEEPAHFSAQAGPKDALWFQLRTACLPSGLAHSCPHICLGQAHVNHSDTTVRPRWLKESHESV